MTDQSTLPKENNGSPNDTSVHLSTLDLDRDFEPQIPKELLSILKRNRQSIKESESYDVKTNATLAPPDHDNLSGVESQLLVLKKWEGTVTFKATDYFLAQLRDLLDSTAPEEAAEFPLSDVSEDDRALIEEGAFFIFSVGQEIDRARNVRRVTNLYFRRMPHWSPNAILSARERAEILEKRLSDGSSA
ncbi:MAG: hypothetical protein HKL90_09445 [Elusimicrobia bacterium]|nr:hypothetical protein [Elusimicrobiota bacterium]